MSENREKQTEERIIADPDLVSRDWDQQKIVK